MTVSTYEFSTEQNVLLAHLGSRMKTVGRIFAVAIGRFGAIPAAW
jgi:hypothetical protein